MANKISPLKLSVRTESGQNLGTVVDVIINPDTQAVLAYHVKPNRLVPDVVWSPLIIAASQVISISPAGIVVDDAVIRQPNQAATPLPTN